MIETQPEQAKPALTTLLPGRDSPPPGVIFQRALRDNVTGIIAWGIGFSTLIIAVVVLYPILEENNMLVGVLGGLGVIDLVARNYPVDVNALASFSGYLAFEALGWGPTLLAVYVVPQVINAVLAEENNGTLFLLMGTPITRWQLLLEKTLAIVVSVMGILGIAWMSLVISVALMPNVDLALDQSLAGMWHIFPTVTLILMLTLLLSVSLRNGRTVGGLVALFIIASFFLRSIADATGSELLQDLRHLSIYHYYSSIGALIDGVRWGNDLGILAVAVLLFGLAIYRFQKRDLW